MTAKSNNKIAIKERMRTFFTKEWRVLVYTLCGIGLCVIDLWRGIGNGAQWSLAVNCTGFFILPFILFRLNWRMLVPGKEDGAAWHKLFRIVFYTWIVLFAILAYPAFKHFAPGTDYDPQIAVAVINAGIYGAVAIRMFFNIFYEERKRKVNYVFMIWLAFTAFAIISVNEAVWPLWFLVMFGAFYLAPLSRKDLDEIFEGLANGLIIGFFLIQGRAFLYRPYDLDPRYRGHYTNPNVNAMFYMFTYVAWLSKLTSFRIRKATKRYAFTFFMASSMWSFVIMTGCRSVLLGMVGITALYWITEYRRSGKKFVPFAGLRALALALCVVASFMPVFWCARYIPPLRHHPKWYGGEYGENSVMSWDPIDSPKYMELEDVLKVSLGRLYFAVEDQTSELETEVQTVSAFAVASSDEGAAAVSVYSEDGEEALAYADGTTPGTDEEHPIYVNADYTHGLRRILKIRYYVYKYILKNIHFFGNDRQIPGVWVLGEFQLYHAHNTALQITYWFGSLCGIFFVLTAVFGLIRNSRNSLGKKALPVMPAIAMLGYLLAGLTECIAFPGEMGMTLFFLSLLPAMRISCE